MIGISPVRARVLPAAVAVLLALTSAGAVEVRRIVPPSLDDAELEQAVRDRLAGRPGVDASAIGVSVSGGALTLTGEVPSIDDRSRIEALVGGVRGVLSLDDKIEIRRREIPDSFLEAEVERKLALYPRLATSHLSVEVSDAAATISGEVSVARDRLQAGEIAGKVEGVREIRNEIRVVTAPVDPGLLRRRLTRLLGNKLIFGRIDRLEVTVVEGGEVTLAGTVATQADRRRAEEIAYGVVGVTRVANDLQIGPLSMPPEP